MRSIDICLSPDLMHLYPVNDKIVVVVDILRATSCMTTALAHGIEHIKPMAHLEECLELRSAGYVTAGERDGKKVAGFDLGNSPFEYMVPELQGKRIAFTTTNGTQAIAKSTGACEIFIGSFLNLSAVIQQLKNRSEDILVVCAGWKGKFNLEDTLFAGAVVAEVSEFAEPACDAPLAAQELWRAQQHRLEEFLAKSSHVKRLARLGINKDIAYCLSLDVYDIAPRMKDGLLIV